MEDQPAIKNGAQQRALLNLHLKNHDFRSALNVFEQASRRGRLLQKDYQRIIVACRQSGEWQTSVRLLTEARAQGHGLTVVAYIVLLTLIEQKQHGLAADLWEVAERDSGWAADDCTALQKKCLRCGAVTLASQIEQHIHALRSLKPGRSSSASRQAPTNVT